MTIHVAVTAPENRADWASRIRQAWQDTLISFIEIGKEIIAAKSALAHGEFEAMIANDLPFTSSTAQRLMKVARDERLTNPAHVQLLPAAWGTLYELTKLDNASFTAAIESGAIKPDMERKDAFRLRQSARRDERLARAETLSRAVAPLGDFAQGRRWPVILADPPWRYETRTVLGKEKSADNHYPTMTRDELKALAVTSLASESAALFMWATVPLLVEAIELMSAWGFTYKSHAVWEKTYADGTPHRGTGFWFINAHELLLLGIRGDMPPPVIGTQALSVIEAPVGRHSEKPALFHQLIERYFPGIGWLELFARARRDGWDVWGNEVVGAVAE